MCLILLVAAAVLLSTPWLAQSVAALPIKGASTHRAHPAPKQFDRGTAAGKKHRVGTKTNVHVPRSFRSYFPTYGPSTALNKASVVQQEQTADAQSFDPETSKEVVEKRTATSTTFQNADGTQTTAFSSGPIRYRDVFHRWHNIDPAFAPEGGHWRTVGGGTGIEVGGERLATVSLGDQSVAWDLVGGEIRRPSVRDDVATYRDVVQDTDVEIQAQAGAAKETLVLHTAKAPRVFDFHMHLDGLKAKLDDGQVLLFNSGGDVVGTIPRGFMQDAKGLTSDDVRYQLRGDVLRVVASEAWLQDSSRSFPVRIDPSISPQKVASATGMTVYTGGATTVGSDFEVGGSQHKRTYLRWDTSSLTNHVIFGASLTMVNYYTDSCTPKPAAVYDVAQSWSLTPGSYSLSNAPSLGRKLDSKSFAYGAVGLGGSSSPCPPKSTSFDLGLSGRNMIQRWVTGQGNNGIAVNAPTDGYKQFVGPGASVNKPTLYVTHSAYNATYKIPNPTPNPVVLKTQDGKINVTITNKSAMDWAAGAFSLRYRVFDSKGKPYSANSAVISVASLPAIARNGKATVVANIQKMPVGTYFLDFSVVRESGTVWFTDQQVPPIRLALQVFNIPPVISEMYPQHGYSAPTLQPELFAKAIDKDATPGTTTYSFNVCTDQAMSANCFNSGTATTSSGWVIPSGKLSWSKQYWWTAKTGSVTSQALTFFTDAPQPNLTSHLAGAVYGAQERDFDPSLGNYSTSAIDAAVATTGPDLTVARTYNSLDPRTDGAFGQGWSTKFDVKAVLATNSVLVTMPDGQVVRFGQNSGGTYVAPRGRNMTFVTGTDPTTWVLTDQTGTMYTFTKSTGQLASIQGSSGLPESFTYVGGRLDKVVSGNSGRGLKFGWNAIGRVSSVSTLDASGAVVTTWTYAYDTIGLLNQACSPLNVCTTYSYTSGSHYRSAVLDDKPDSYWRLGEEVGTAKASSEVAVNLGADEASYDAGVALGQPGALANVTNTGVTFNGTSAAIRLPGGAAKKSRDMTVELWFKATGTSTTGRPLIGYQNKVFDGATAPTTGVPMLYIGTDGKLRGQFADGTMAPVTSVAAVNNNVWHHVALTAFGGATTLYVDGVFQNTKTSTINQAALTFNQLGAAYATGTTWPSYGTTVGKRYFNGSMDDVAIYSHGLSAAEIKDHFVAAAGTKQLSQVTLPSGKVAAEVKYDVETDRVSQYTDRNGGTWDLGVPVVAGSPTDMRRTVTYTDPAGRLYLSEYDALTGYLLRSASPNGNTVRPQDTQLCLPATAGDPMFCAPPPDDPNQSQIWDMSGSDIRSMDYNVDGQVTAVYDELGDAVTMSYDSRGNVITRTTCRTSTDCSTTYTKYPDSTSNYGPLDPRWDKPLETRDARSSSATDNRYRTTYTYTQTGQLATQTGPGPDNAQVTNIYSTGQELSADGDGSKIPSGLPLSSTDARPASTTFSYFKTGDLASITEPSGLVTKYTYDSLGRTKTESTIWGGRTTTTAYTYDDQSRVTKTVMPVVRDEVNGVDHQKQIIQTYDPDGNVSKTEVSDALGNDAPRATTYGYDDFNRMSDVTDPLGNTIYYTYDEFGNQTSMVDANGTRTEFAYTARNKLAEVRLVDPDRNGSTGWLVTTAYAYDAAGRLAMTFDAQGRQVVIDYLQDNLVSKKTLMTFRRPGTSTDTPYVLEQYAYDKAGNVLTETTGNGTRTVNYTRDEYGRVKTQTTGTYPLTRTETYTYDKVGNVTQVDSSGVKSNVPWTTTDTSSVSYGYDAAGRETSETTALASGTATTTTEYDELGHVTRVVGARGNVAGANASDYAATYGYDAAGNLNKVTLPPTMREEYGTAAAMANAVSQTGYNTYGEPVASKDALGQVSKVEYDQRGEVTKQIDPSYTAPGTSTALVPTTLFSYDANGNQVQTTDPYGSVTKSVYDRLGRVIQVDAPSKDNSDRAVTNIAYTRTGQIRRVDGPMGSHVENTYDDLDRRVSTTTFDTVPVADTFTTTFAYDDNNNVTSVKSALQNETKSTYDALGQLLTVTDPAGVATSFGYDGAGRQVMVKDALGRTSRTDYDVAGRATTNVQLSSTGVEGPKETFEYDVDGNMTKSTPVGVLPTTYEYDALGRITKQVEPVSASSSITTTAGYDLAGDRTRYTDGRGNATWSTFNSFGLDSVIEPSTLNQTSLTDRRWQSVYDIGGRPVTLTAPGGVTRQRTYDAAGRLTKETGSGAEAATSTRNLTYNTAGRLTSLSTPSGNDTYSYNDRGMLVSSSGPSGASSFTYDKDGELTGRTDASGTAAFGYTGGQLSSITDAATGAQIGLTYDGTGAPATMNYGAGRVRTFSYDGNGRLSSDVLKNSAQQTVESTGYEYDSRSHVSRKTTTGVAGASDNTYTYDQDGRMSTWAVANGATTSYTWDASGNRTKVNSTVSTYDERNRLISDGTTDYSYSPRGSLLSRTNGSNTEAFTFDAFDRMISDGSHSYSYDASDRVATADGDPFKYSGLDDDVVSDGTSIFGRGPGGGVLSDKTGTRNRLLISDQHGDVVAGFDPADSTLATVPESRTFDPWGNAIASQGTVSSAGFQGSWTDTATGEINMKARWYDSGSGTFDSRDTLGYDAGPSITANRYTYGAGDPVTLSDADGHCGFCSFVKHKASSAVHAVKDVASAGAHYAEKAYNYTKSAVSKVYNFASSAVSMLIDSASYLLNKVKSGLNAVINATKAGINWAKDKVSDGIAWARQKAAQAAAAAHRAAVALTEKTKAVIAHAAKYNPLPIVAKAVAPVFANAKKIVSAVANAPAMIVQATVDVVKSTAKQVQAIYNATVIAAGDVVQAVSTAVSSAAEWTQNNWKTIASIATGIAVGAACTAVTAGAGGPACALLGTAVTGAMSGALDCPPGKSVASCMGKGAVSAVIAPVTDAMSCAMDKNIAGCASVAADLLPAVGSRVGGKFLSKLSKDCNCFAAGTKVATAKGEKPIEQVKVGDKVWAKDMVTGKNRLRPVKQVFSHVAVSMMTIVIAGTSMQVTTEHPFHTPDHGWVQSGQLKVGDEVSLIDGRNAKIESINRYDEPTRVYNFEVVGDHNYAVGAAGVLVHNSAGVCSTGSIDYGSLDEAGRPTGITANLTPDMVGTGSAASRDILPPGFGGRAAGHARGHLLARQLGGSGDIPENLVTLLQTPVNNSRMLRLENQVRRALDEGQSVAYSVTPVYRGAEGIPIGLTMRAQGSGGLDFYLSILNSG